MVEQEQLPQRFGPFVLMRLLGIGGMGKAYLAHHPDWESDLVLKRMHAHFMEDQSIFKRFVHEAQVATYVRHKNVAALVAMGTVDREPFFATEFVFGIPVSGIVERVQGSMTSPLPLGVALHLGIDLLSGVEAIHEARDVQTGAPLELIHRDLSARNVLVGFDGVLRIIDLGLGKSVLADWQTATDVVAGSPDYMPREQALGSRVDRRADVYAAAVTVWELLAGRKRIQEPNVAARITRAIEATPEPLLTLRPDASAELERALQQAMAPDVEDRTASAGALRDALKKELAKLRPPVERKEVTAWIEHACATAIAREKRLLDEAKSRVKELEAGPQPSKTQILAAYPVAFVKKQPVAEEEPEPANEVVHEGEARRRAERGYRDTAIHERKLSAPDATVAEGARAAIEGKAKQLETEVRRVIGRIERLPPGAHAAMLLALALLSIGLVSLVLKRLPASSGPVAIDPNQGGASTGVLVEPLATPPEDPAAGEPEPPPEAVEPPDAGLAAKPVAIPGGEQPVQEKIPPEVLARREALLSRLRALRKVRFDVAFQRKLTQIGQRLSRAKSDRELDQIEAALEDLAR